MNEGAGLQKIDSDAPLAHIPDLDARVAAAHLAGEMHGRLRVYSISGVEACPHFKSATQYRAKHYSWPRRLDRYLVHTGRITERPTKVDKMHWDLLRNTLIGNYLFLDLINETTGAGRIIPPYLEPNKHVTQRIAQAYISGFRSTCESPALQTLYFNMLYNNVATTFRGDSLKL